MFQMFRFVQVWKYLTLFVGIIPGRFEDNFLINNDVKFFKDSFVLYLHCYTFTYVPEHVVSVVDVYYFYVFYIWIVYIKETTPTRPLYRGRVMFWTHIRNNPTSTFLPNKFVFEF